MKHLIPNTEINARLRFILGSLEHVFDIRLSRLAFVAPYRTLISAIGITQHQQQPARCDAARGIFTAVAVATAVVSALVIPTVAEGSLKPKEPPTFSVVQGFGAGFGPTVTRIGLWSWELGLLNAGTNMSSFGGMYTFRDGPFFSGVGLVAFNALLLGPTSPGVFGAFGLEQNMFWGLFARLELNAEVTFDGSAQASSALIIGWGYW